MKNKIMKDLSLLFLILFVFINSKPLNAQQTNIFSFNLKQAQDYAVENNLNLKNARIDVELAKKKIWEVASSGLPQVSVAANYQHIFVVPEVSFPGTVISDKRDENTLYGVEVAGDSIFMNTLDSPPIKLGVQDNITFDINVTQLIFSGQYLIGLQATKIYSRFAEEGVTKSEFDVRESVANNYYLILNLENNLKIVKQSEENLKKTLTDMREMLKQGFIENTDVDQIELTTLNLGNAVKTLERQVESSGKLLKFQLGIPLETTVNLTDDLENMISSISLGSILDQPFNLENNITYQLLTTQEKLLEINLKREKSNYLPTIAAFYRHSERAKKAQFDFTMKDIAGLSVNIPVFSSGMRNTLVMERKLELDKMRNNKNLAAEGLKLEYANAENECRTAFEKYFNEKKNIELANKIYEKTLLKYKEGVSSSLDLTTAQNQFLTAQANYFNASFALLSAKSKLDKLNSKL